MQRITYKKKLLVNINAIFGNFILKRDFINRKSSKLCHFIKVKWLKSFGIFELYEVLFKDVHTCNTRKKKRETPADFSACLPHYEWIFWAPEYLFFRVITMTLYCTWPWIWKIQFSITHGLHFLINMKENSCNSSAQKIEWTFCETCLAKFALFDYRTHANRPRSVYSIFHFFAYGLFKKSVYLANLLAGRLARKKPTLAVLWSN